MKKTLVATYGYTLVGSSFSAKTLNVQQFPSTFSTLKTEEHVPVVPCPAKDSVESLTDDTLHGTPLG